MRVLTINTGSSSLKAGLYQVKGPGAERLEATVKAQHLATVAEFEAALARGLEPFARPDAIGHRIVAPGAAWSQHRILDADVIEQMRGLVEEAPEHLPQALAAVERTRAEYPGVPQVACSDSAFHQTMPEVARRLALPRWVREEGVQRWGYHGLSCEFILSALRAHESKAARGRMVIAHLGNGASLTALREGKSVETTMGFTPAGGLPMSTRSGDLDPGVLLYLMRHDKPSADDLGRLLNQEAGLLGVSGISGDMQELLEKSESNAGAAAAVETFVYQAQKHIGALAAVLGGVDTLVFTGGIGENSAEIRDRISAGMEWLGMKVLVIATDEDRMIARHTAAALRT